MRTQVKEMRRQVIAIEHIPVIEGDQNTNLVRGLKIDVVYFG
jgi:hypothetical protein